MVPQIPQVLGQQRHEKGGVFGVADLFERGQRALVVGESLAVMGAHGLDQTLQPVPVAQERPVAEPLGFGAHNLDAPEGRIEIAGIVVGHGQALERPKPRRARGALEPLRRGLQHRSRLLDPQSVELPLGVREGLVRGGKSPKPARAGPLVERSASGPDHLAAHGIPAEIRMDASCDLRHVQRARRGCATALADLRTPSGEQVIAHPFPRGLPILVDERANPLEVAVFSVSFDLLASERPPLGGGGPVQGFQVPARLVGP